MPGTAPEAPRSRLVSLVRELERDPPEAAGTAPTPRLPRLAVVGRGRVGGAIAAAARAGGPRRRAARARRASQRLRRRRGGAPLRPRRRDPRCLREIAAAAPAASRWSATRAAPPASTRSARSRRGAPRPSSLHPLQTIPDGDADLAGAPCAVAGSTPEARRLARALAERLGMRPFEVPEEARAAYHAAASIASNFLVALEESAARAAATRRASRTRASCWPRWSFARAANWAERGARGPHRPDRPRRRGNCRAPPRGARRARAGAAARSTRRSPSAPATPGGRTRPMRVVAHKGRASRGAGARAPRGPLDRPGADDGRTSTTGHLSLLRGGARALRRRRHEPVRQPGPVRPRRGPRRATRATRRAT